MEFAPPMPPLTRPLTMYTRDTVLFANEAFYHAFATANFEAMNELWARNTPVTCIHPGWHALHDREQIMDVWRGVFTRGQQAPLSCRAPEAFVMGEVAFVVCYEELPDSLLIATNIFHREQQHWRMVHHQSGPTPTHPSQLATPPTSVPLAN